MVWSTAGMSRCPRLYGKRTSALTTATARAASSCLCRRRLEDQAIAVIVAEAVGWFPIDDDFALKGEDSRGRAGQVPGQGRDAGWSLEVGHLDDNAGAASLTLTSGELAALDALGAAAGQRYADMRSIDT